MAAFSIGYSVVERASVNEEVVPDGPDRETCFSNLTFANPPSLLTLLELESTGLHHYSPLLSALALLSPVPGTGTYKVHLTPSPVGLLRSQS